MTDLRPGDVVIVEFPYTDRPDYEVRPAVVVSARPVGSRWPLIWAVMITSAIRKEWPGDIPIANYVDVGSEGLASFGPRKLPISKPKARNSSEDWMPTSRRE